MIKKIFSHSFWLLIGNSIGRLSIFLTNIVAARLLSQEDFGQFAMIRNTISMIEGMISGTIGSPVIKRSSEMYTKDSFASIFKALLLVNITIAIIMASSILLFAPYITDVFFKSNLEFMQGLYIGVFLLLTTSLSTFIQNIFIGIEKYQKLAIASIYTSLFSFPIILFLIYNYKLYGVLYGISFYFFIDFMFKYYQFQKIVPIAFEIPDFMLIRDEAKRLFLFSYPLFWAILVSSVSFWYARIIIVDTDGFSSLAIFDAAFQWLTVIMIVTGATTSVVLPMLSKINLKIDSKMYNKTILINLGINLIIASFFAFIFTFFSKEIMSIYGDKYIEGYTVLIILSITSIFFSLSSIMNKVFISINYSLEIFYINFISSSLILILLKLNFLSGAVGLSYSFLYFYFCNCMLYFLIYLYKRWSKDV